MRAGGTIFLGRRGEVWFGVAVAALVAAYATSFILKPDQLFADDTYFYLQVAWNFARGMGSTFNTIMPTNGYHPLWMLICAAVYKVVPSKTAGVHAIAAVISALDILMLLTVRRIVLHVAGDLWIFSFLLLIPFSFLSQLGTEGALSCLFLALLMLTGYQLSELPSSRNAFMFSLVAAIAVLSRLDNIFIVSFAWLAQWFALGEPDKRVGRRFLMWMLPIFVVLWGSYIASNLIYFHTIQPISGVLKSSRTEHSLHGNFPHVAWLALGVIAVCLPIVAIWKRDLFFRVVEIPFTLGVLCHFAYIGLRMSSETRWSWYYTSWILLGSILLARAGSVVVKERGWLAVPSAVLCVMILSAAWVRFSYRYCFVLPDMRPPADFNDIYKKAGIRAAFTYDEPGGLAYYSDVKIIPLDGLMGNIDFQRDLARKGVRAVTVKDHVDGFIGPPMPLSEADAKSYCDRFFVSSATLRCVQDGPDTWQVSSVDVFARVPSAPAGSLALDKNEIVWSRRNSVAVWRINPSIDPATGQRSGTK
jgi:hypothetical protein